MTNIQKIMIPPSALGELANEGRTTLEDADRGHEVELVVKDE